MAQSKARPLGMSAVFYDIIFTFVIDRLARSLLYANRGTIDWRSCVSFGLMALCSWTVWTYQVIYASRAPARPLLDSLYLALNLFLSIYLTTTIGVWTVAPTISTKLSTALLFFSLASQYWLNGRGSAVKQPAFIVPLLLGGVIACFATIVPGPAMGGQILYVIGILIPAGGPWLLRNRIPETNSHFRAISTRITLFTVLLFARSVMQVTDSLANLELQPVLFFVSTVLMLASYLLVVELGIDAHTKQSSMFALLIHMPLMATILMMANVTRLFINGRIIPVNFAIWMIILLAIYTVALALYLLVYQRDGLDTSLKRGRFFVIALLCFTLYGVVTVNIGALFLMGMCAYLFACDLFLWQFVLNPPQVSDDEPQDEDDANKNNHDSE
ncbi:low temperature requirement protein A [Lacticaseibacillus zhaodongensis]|uniref:low temperature requirement protein A n=1 Tax=Lacticaseibacillus zhaodongensis TaxID=2668065 RepID=UPI0012D2D519|nr:low temperature requirement protein A [Lacticaseibacillus zhaodongensis]